MSDLISDAERLARLRLFRSRGIGPLTFAQLMERFGSALNAVRKLPETVSEAGRRDVRLAPEGLAEAELERLLEMGGRLITFGEPNYPEPLAMIADPPPVLSCLGDPAHFSKLGVAIVGARNASAAGRSFARTLAQDLGEEGFAVISGMARGIDGAAHEAALKTGTIAVLAGGVDSIYPPEHRALHKQLSERGLILSEQPLGMTARAKDFPKRNRIVSGLSRGVVVVEAAERSGTLITARLAGEQGRDLFAVPGSPLDPRSRGTNTLLRRGAILVRDADDIISELEGATGRLFEPPANWDVGGEIDEGEQNSLRGELLSLLSFTPTHRDQLIAETRASTAAVAMALLDLVLEGHAEEESGGSYVLTASGSGSGSGLGT